MTELARQPLKTAEPDADRQDAVAGADRLSAVAAAAADRTDASAELPAQVQAALLASGFARHFVPARFGGTEGSYAAVLESVLQVGTGCGSTGWLASLIAAVGRLAACLPAEGQAELWDGDPDVVLAASLVPLGQARPVPGGHRLSGTWTYVSGVELAGWVLLVATVADGAQLFALPRAQVTVRPTWQALGMRATGSHAVTVQDAFVPLTRSVSRPELDANQRAGSPVVPNRTVTGLFFAAPMLGAATGCRSSWAAAVDRRVAERGGFGSASERLGCQTTLARADAELDQARLLLDRIAVLADHRPDDLVAGHRGPRDSAIAAELASTAAQRVVAAAGTDALSAATAVQRFYRDVCTVASHGTLRFVTKAEAYARSVWPAGG